MTAPSVLKRIVEIVLTAESQVEGYSITLWCAIDHYVIL